MGIVIRPGTVRQGLLRQNRAMRDIVAGISLAESKISEYTGEGELEGKAFDSHKAYMDKGHLEFLDKYRMALEETMEANDTHRNLINTELSSCYYNETKILEEIEELRVSIERHDSQIAAMKLQGICSRSWEDSRSILVARRNYLRYDKLERLYSYRDSTPSIYSSAEGQFAEANRLLMVLETATQTHCPETGILIMTMLSVDDAEIQFLLNVELRNKDGEICWDAVEEMLRRGYDDLSANEISALAEIYMSIDDPNEFARFINAMAVPIGPGPSMMGVLNPEWLSEEERSAFSEPNAVWDFDSRLANAINERVEMRIVDLWVQEWMIVLGYDDADPSVASVAGQERLRLLQHHAAMYVVSDLPLVLGPLDGPGIIITRNEETYCLVIGFSQVERHLNNDFVDWVPHNSSDGMRWTNFRSREITVSTAYGFVPAGESGTNFGDAIIDRVQDSALSNHEFDLEAAVLSEAINAALGEIPFSGTLAGAGVGILSDYFDAQEMQRTINEITDAARLALFVQERRLNGVFISEDGVYQPPQLWFSPYTTLTVPQPEIQTERPSWGE